MTDALTDADLLAAVAASDRARPDDLAERLGVERQTVTETMRTLLEAGVVAVAPRYGTYRLTRRGRIVKREYESRDDADLGTLIEDVAPQTGVVDATAGP
jgi:Mn-dependent DtxR family transcriptional regulator